MLSLKKSIFLDTLRQPFRKAIITAASLGAEAVEVNGRTEVRADQLSRTGIRQIRKLLSDVNLKISAIHFQTEYGYGNLTMLDQRIEATKATMQLAYDLGARVVVNRIGKISADNQSPEWTTMQQALADIGNHGQKTGAWLAARTGADNGETLKSLIEALPVQALGVDFDPAELIINGHCPDEAMQVLSAHVFNCRARDAVTDFSLGRGVEMPLGQGTVDWPNLLGQLERQAYGGFLTLQQNNAANPPVDCQLGFDYLQGLFG